MDKVQLEELLKSFGEMIDKKLSAYDENRKAEEKKQENKENDLLKQAEDEVKQRNTAKKAEDLEKERTLEAFKWNATIKDFLKSNKEYLPENLEDIINVLEAKSYASDVEKAQELKRAVVEQYIKNQDNLNNLPDSLKAKAEKYAGFTTKEKLDRALDYYDIVETGIHTAKNIKKAEAIEKGGSESSEKSAVEEYEEKMLNFSKETLSNENK